MSIYLWNTLDGRQTTAAHNIAFLIGHFDTVYDFLLTHQWNINAIGRCYRCERNVTLNERTGSSLPVAFASDGRNQSARGGRNVADAQLINGNRRVSITVSVVDKRIKRLIDPLPEDNSRNGSRI